MQRPLYIFDLDGTLANNDHRKHLVEGEKKDWRAFYAASGADRPVDAVITTLRALVAAGADVWIWSGRSAEVESITVSWVEQHGAFGTALGGAEQLKMRREGDFTPDEVLKRDWLLSMQPKDRARLVAVFDDRDKMVAMWRANGVPCVQVAPGAF